MSLPIIKQDFYTRKFYLNALSNGKWERVYEHQHHTQVEKYADKHYPEYIMTLRNGCETIKSIAYHENKQK